MTRRLLMLLIGSCMVLLMPQANAGLIATDEGSAQDERARVKALVVRPELAKAMQDMGLEPSAAAARVDAMNDAEVLQLAGRLDTALAGGQISNQNLLLIIIIVILLILLL